MKSIGKIIIASLSFFCFSQAASQHFLCIVEMHCRKLRHDDTSARNVTHYLGYALFVSQPGFSSTFELCLYYFCAIYGITPRSMFFGMSKCMYLLLLKNNPQTSERDKILFQIICKKNHGRVFRSSL